MKFFKQGLFALLVVVFSLYCFQGDAAQKSVINGTVAQDMTDANDNFTELYTWMATIDTEAEFKALYNLEIGTDVLAQQSIGILDNYLLEVDGSPNDDEYARFTANGLEGRTESEFKADFNLEAGTDFYSISAADTLLAAKVGDTGNETIAGIKTFSSDPIISGLTASRVLVSSATKELNTSAVTATELGYVSGVTSSLQTQIDATVKDTGNEEVAGVKTFTSSPVVPTPTTDMQSSTKKYVDDEIDSSFVLATPVASTSGTEIDFTSIPSGTKRITIMGVGVSTNGTAGFRFLLGDSGGMETTGYNGSWFNYSAQTLAGTSAFELTDTIVAASTYDFKLVLDLENESSFTWSMNGTFASVATVSLTTGMGTKSLSAELTQLRITTSNGTDTFDAGEINISYE